MTAEPVWTSVDEYIADLFRLRDSVLEDALRRCRQAGLPAIEVSVAQGALLEVLVRATAAKRVIEIGTLGGFSAICLARGLPSDGVLISLEIDPHHAAIARMNLADAGLADRVEVVEGPALDSLARLLGEECGPFDLVFIDGDKQSYVAYLQAVLPLCREGTMIVADNVVQEGAVLDPEAADPTVQGVRHFNAAIAIDPRLRGTVIQTVGLKGHDGMALVVVSGND